MAVTRIHNPLSSGVDRVFYMTSPGTTGTVFLAPMTTASDGDFRFGISDRHVTPNFAIYFQPAALGSTGFIGPYIAASTGGTPAGSTAADTTVVTSIFFGNLLFSNLETGGDNYLVVQGSTGGGLPAPSAPPIVAFGVDTDIDILLSPKGSGVFHFNQWTKTLGGGAAATLGTIGGASGPAAAAQAGWLPIRITTTTGFFFIPVWQ